MLVLGVPLALPLAVLVFFSGYIPYFGGIVATGIILLVTYAALGAGPIVVMLLLIAIRNAILGYGVRPAVYGRTVSIHPALVLVALPAGFELAGVVGLFAAVPVTAVCSRSPSATVAIVDPGPRPGAPRPGPGLARPGRTVELAAARRPRPGRAGRLHLRAMPLVVIPIVLATILAATLDPLVRRPRPTRPTPGPGRRDRRRRRVPGDHPAPGGHLRGAGQPDRARSSSVGLDRRRRGDSAAGGNLGLLTSAVSRGRDRADEDRRLGRVRRRARSWWSSS